MPYSAGNEARLTNLFHASQKRFGELLREVCEISGFTQGNLSREAKKELQRLIQAGEIFPDDPIGSMEQPAISKVMAGLQAPTYFQVYIWLKVIEEHYNSDEFTEICHQLHIAHPPVFTDQLKQELWRLATFVPPDELHENYKNTKDLKLIEIHTPLIDHKEIRWEKTKNRSTRKETSTNTKPSNNADTPYRIASMKRTH
jgi:hypothetical protein